MDSSIHKYSFLIFVYTSFAYPTLPPIKKVACSQLSHFGCARNNCELGLLPTRKPWMFNSGVSEVLFFFM